MFFIIIKAIYPKGYKSPYEKPTPLMLKIAIMLMPYFRFFLFFFALLVLVKCRFDYKEIEKLRELREATYKKDKK
ncbi:hypothetical protein [Campylobacter gastrosuis]|uniref:Uncharacterized protein n=1 Tax=Campylobacter gastrosuis TaxID=2974576 RepID=A0ABT7HNJ4_9BACT|nr:hypothetical protein [Campylobacter gastrosuis]MDL0088485.1 hypothetical protein [Campylobacter gastrosuis]